jgi:hypothetical protein
MFRNLNRKEILGVDVGFTQIVALGIHFQKPPCNCCYMHGLEEYFNMNGV